MDKKNSGDLVKNRKAFHDYEILDSYEAGIALQGTEVKSLRDHGGSLQEAYVQVEKGEVWLVGAHIAQYRFGNIHNHDETRDRKLLLHKKEIKKLKNAVGEKGLTIIPLALYLKRGKVKVKIAVARGKKNIDKRMTIKNRDEKRRVQQAMRQSSY